LPWKCNNAFYLHRYVVVNKRNFAKVSPITAEMIHVGRGKDMTKLIPAFRANENARLCVLLREVFAVNK